MGSGDEIGFSTNKTWTLSRIPFRQKTTTTRTNELNIKARFSVRESGSLEISSLRRWFDYFRFVKLHSHTHRKGNIVNQLTTNNYTSFDDLDFSN